MRTRIVDLDGSLLGQHEVLKSWRPEVVPLGDWGPRIRLACSFGRFRRFERALAASEEPDAPTLTFYGSGDFHHVSLALVRRLRQPCNLLVLDKHPDWMRGLPFLHCGTWLYHAARLPHVGRVFHVGGELDFDNAYRWMAPWPLLRSGRITVFPALRRFRRGTWRWVPHTSLRESPGMPATAERLALLLRPFADDLARWPLYVSLDKDVLVQEDAVVNWDSGHLRLAEAQAVLAAFLAAAQHRLAGMDIVGDWSPVAVQGWFRWLFHATEHPPLAVEPAAATRCNERTNLALLGTLEGVVKR